LQSLLIASRKFGLFESFHHDEAAKGVALTVMGNGHIDDICVVSLPQNCIRADLAQNSPCGPQITLRTALNHKYNSGSATSEIIHL